MSVVSKAKRRRVKVDAEISWLMRVLEVTVSAFIVGTAVFALLYVMRAFNTSDFLRF